MMYVVIDSLVEENANTCGFFFYQIGNTNLNYVKKLMMNIVCMEIAAKFWHVISKRAQKKTWENSFDYLGSQWCVLSHMSQGSA